jgi:hypothetical protein
LISSVVLAIAAAACGASTQERAGKTTLTSGINPAEGAAARQAPPPGAVYVPGGSPMTDVPSAKTGDDDAPTAGVDIGPERYPAQGDSRLELDTTATIHESLMADKSLSPFAQHVVVITSGSTVTLRGTVRDEAERWRVTSIAQAAPGVVSVSDRLAVAPP